jgi:hypothetical protein
MTKFNMIPNSCPHKVVTVLEGLAMQRAAMMEKWYVQLV